jgi:glyceraldehyde-3-phosphate dehydrogenase (NADP+)
MTKKKAKKTGGKTDLPVFRMLIGGKWVASSDKKTQKVYTPIDGAEIAEVQKATKKDAEKAIDSAYNNKDKIADMPAVDRAKILEEIGELVYDYYDELVDLIVLDAGKPISVAEGEVKATAERFKYAAEEAKQITGESMLGDTVPWHKEKIGMVIRQPLGVVLAISPFNYPLFIASAKIAPALAAGNSVVCKPASADPLPLLFLAELIQLAGLPEGVFNVVTGSGSEIGDTLASSDKINMISFTGSSPVGKRIGELAVLQKLHLELGGKSPALVLEDADLDIAAKQCISGAFKFSGQRCDAISRILVEKKVADRFVKKLLAEAKKWKSGDPYEEDVKIGPLIDDRAVSKVDSLVKDAKKKGAKVLLGGKKGKGLYYQPTVLDKVTPKMKIAWEETFGPVATVMRVKDYEEAIKLANESEYGLDASVFTQDVDKAIDAGMRLEDGTVNINAAPAHGLGNFPFGGDKDSGMDREGIKFSVDEMTKVHTIVFNPKKK